MKYTLKSGITCRFFCQKENKLYILQDCGGSHLGFMDEQDLKIKSSIRNDLFIKKNHIERWYYTSFSDEKCKIYIF